MTYYRSPLANPPRAPAETSRLRLREWLLDLREAKRHWLLMKQTGNDEERYWAGWDLGAYKAWFRREWKYYRRCMAGKHPPINHHYDPGEGFSTWLNRASR